MLNNIVTVKELDMSLERFLENNIKEIDDIVITIYLGENNFVSTRNIYGIIDSKGPYKYSMDEFLELRLKEANLKSNKIKLRKEMRYIKKNNPSSMFETRLFYKESNIKASLIELSLNDVRRFIKSGLYYLIHVSNSSFRLKNL